MFIDGLTNSGALPTLERSMQFAARRQELVAHNIANLSTPNFQPMDVSVSSFQSALADAVERRRRQFGGSRGSLEFENTREVQITDQGVQLTPQTSSGNILFHDRNNRDLERQMQAMVENLTAFRTAADLFKSRLDLLNTAIRERF